MVNHKPWSWAGTSSLQNWGRQEGPSSKSPIRKAALWPGTRGMKLFMKLQAIKMMSLEESVYMVRIMCRNLWPPKFCISLVRQAKSAHTEGVQLTSLARAEAKGGRKWITSTRRWFIAAFLWHQVLYRSSSSAFYIWPLMLENSTTGKTTKWPPER